MKVINANIQTQSTSYINLQSVFVCHTNKVSPQYSQQKTKSYQKKHSLAKLWHHSTARILKTFTKGHMDKLMSMQSNAKIIPNIFFHSTPVFQVLFCPDLTLIHAFILIYTHTPPYHSSDRYKNNYITCLQPSM